MVQSPWGIQPRLAWHPLSPSRRRNCDPVIFIPLTQERPLYFFPFEAKRLGQHHPVADYVGAEGLGCFLRGDYDAAKDDAGMLGYVQLDTAEKWARKIQAKLEEPRSDFAVCDNYTWREYQLKSGPTHIYHRVALGRPIDIYHTLLVFC